MKRLPFTAGRGLASAMTRTARSASSHALANMNEAKNLGRPFIRTEAQVMPRRTTFKTKGHENGLIPLVQKVPHLVSELTTKTCPHKGQQLSKQYCALNILRCTTTLKHNWRELKPLVCKRRSLPCPPSPPGRLSRAPPRPPGCPRQSYWSRSAAPAG
jgi:hypothetical protein